MFAVLVLSFILSISFGISILLMRQIKMLKNTGYSVAAFYAADAGIERVLIDRSNLNLTPGYYSDDLDNGASY